MKFSTRDLLLVTVIVALVLGWGVDHGRLQKQAALGEAFKECTIILARALERHGVYAPVFSNGTVGLEPIDPSLPYGGYSYFDKTDLLWEPEAVRKFDAESHRRSSDLPNPSAPAPNPEP